MPSGGTLRVSCDNFSYDGQSEPLIPDLIPGVYIRISVKDEGVGISEHYLKRIFDPYFTTKSHGNGLGLATTYSIIKNHNGLITVESQLHVGSTFTIYLPALKNQEIPVEPAGLIPAPAAGSGVGTGRILIVETRKRSARWSNHAYAARLESPGRKCLDGVKFTAKISSGENDRRVIAILLLRRMGGKEALKS